MIGVAVEIENPGFEDGFDGWTQVEPVAESGVANTGSGSAKVEAAGAMFSQEVEVEPGAQYVLQAYVNGKGKLGAKVGGNVSTIDVASSEYQQVTLRFQAVNGTTAEIFGTFGNDGDVRFDDFTLVKTDDVDGTTSTTGPIVTTTTTEPTTTTTVEPIDGPFNPAIWDSSEAGDYLESTDPVVMSFDGMEQFTATPNGSGPRDELKTPEDFRVGSDETYEAFSADITFNLDVGTKLIAHQIHGDDPTLVKLYVQDSSSLGIFKGEGESDWSLDDYPILDGVANNGVFDVYVRVRIPGFVSGDDIANEEIFALGTIESGDTIRYEFVNDFGVVTVNSEVGSNTEGFTYDIHDTPAAYMKFGSYVQAQDAATGCNYDDDDIGIVDCTDWAGPFATWEDFFSAANISTAEVVFTNVVHEGGPLQ